MYKTANDYYKEKFGCKVYKLSVDGGFSCPNRDGKIDTRGCIFCLNGSGDFAAETSTRESTLETPGRTRKFFLSFIS